MGGKGTWHFLVFCSALRASAKFRRQASMQRQGKKQRRAPKVLSNHTPDLFALLLVLILVSCEGEGVVRAGPQRMFCLPSSTWAGRVAGLHGLILNGPPSCQAGPGGRGRETVADCHYLHSSCGRPCRKQRQSGNRLFGVVFCC
jgi:hypothetical protein